MKRFEDPEVYKNVLQALPSGVYLVNEEQKIVFWNDGAAALTGYLSQEVLGKDCGESFLGHVDSDNRLLTGEMAPLVAAMRDGRAVEAQLSLRHKQGHPVQVRLRATPLRNASGHIIGALECFDEAGALHFETRGSKLALFGCVDTRTGAATREYTETQIQEHIETFEHHRMPFSLLAIQVDELERLKARDGVAAVNTVLKVAAQTLADTLRPTDLLGRWSETVFLALAAECNLAEAQRVAERLHHAVGGAQAAWWGDPLKLTATIGGACVREGDNVELVVKRAEAALQTGIAKGGNCVLIGRD